MNRNTKIVLRILLLLAVLAVLLVPVRTVYDDGGTVAYAALTYKVMVWKRLQAEVDENGNLVELERYEKTSVYFFPDHFKSYEALWNLEQAG